MLQLPTDKADKAHLLSTDCYADQSLHVDLQPPEKKQAGENSLQDAKIEFFNQSIIILAKYSAMKLKTKEGLEGDGGELKLPLPSTQVNL